MPQDISEARRALAKARDAANSRLEKLEKERQDANASIKALDAAIKALDKNGLADSSEGPRATNKAAATTKDVVKLAEQCLTDSPPMSRKDLLADIGKRLTATGRSRVGLGIRLNQALKSERFEKTEAGYGLAQQHKPAVDLFDAALASEDSLSRSERTRP